MKTPSAVVDFQSLPLILTLHELAGIYRISIATIRRGLQNGTFRPRPWDKYPYRWKREDVAADLERERPEPTMRKHGFASTRLQPAKAPLRSTRQSRRNPAAS